MSKKTVKNLAGFALAILRKASGYGLVFVLSTTAIFFLVRKAPGSPFSSDRVMPAEVKAAVEKKYRLDLPPREQFVLYAKDALRGDLGPSYDKPARSVQSLLAEGLPSTIVLGLLSMLLAVAIGCGAGIFAALYHNRVVDRVVMALSMQGIVWPSFVIGPLLILFAAKTRLFPVRGWGEPIQAVLPIVTFSLYYCAVIARYARGGMLEVLRSDYVLAATAKGLPKWKVVVRHTLQGGLWPVITYLGPALADAFAGGSLVVEQLFGIDGIASYFLTAAFSRDYPMLLGSGILFTALILSMNLLVDIAYVAIDPRLRRRSS